MSASTNPTNHPQPFRDSLESAARRRCTLYRQFFTAQGLRPDQPFRCVAVLTTDLPGEVIEVAIVDEGNRVFTRRAAPVQSISPGAQAHHGLSMDDLEHEWPLSSWVQRLESLLAAPGPDGQAVPVVAWAGRFLQEAFTNSLGRPLGVDVIDLQAPVSQADREINPYSRFRPSLQGMNWTVPLPQVDPRAARNAALCTRLMLREVMTEQVVTTPPTTAGQPRRNHQVT